MDIVSKAITVATQAHAGQLDKVGRPYILHPLRVMTALGFEACLEAQAIAALHDTIEDTKLTYDDICNDFSLYIADGVQVLTRPRNKPYEQYIKEILAYGNQMLIDIKIADLEDNLNVRRQITCMDPLIFANVNLEKHYIGWRQIHGLPYGQYKKPSGV